MRRNHPRRNSHTPNLDLFDVEYIDLPEHPETSRIIALPMKTIYFNTAANTDASIDRVFSDAWAFAQFLGNTRYGMMLGL